jgi:hypothetical protein
MFVYLNNEMYDSNKLPIAIILSDEEKGHIHDMAADAHKYLSAPEGTTPDEMRSILKKIRDMGY